MEKKNDHFSHETCSDLTYECAIGALQQEGEREEEETDGEQQFLKLLWCGDQSREFNNPTEQRSYKNTFSHLTNFHCVELFQICFLSFVRLRLRDQFSPVDMEKSVAFTSIS